MGADKIETTCWDEIEITMDSSMAEKYESRGQMFDRSEIEMKYPRNNKNNDDPREVVGVTNIIQSRNDNLLDDSCGGGEEDCSEDLDDNDHMMPGLLEAGISYTVKRILTQGWVHKKGTGQDWIASRAWKARWAVLAVSFVCVCVCFLEFSNYRLICLSLCRRRVLCS